MSGRLGNRSPAVREWISLADPYIYAIKPLRMIIGRYALHVTWPAAQFGAFDCDNRIKVLQDYLQRIRAINNDRDCWKLTAEFGDVKRGMCRVMIEALG